MSQSQKKQFNLLIQKRALLKKLQQQQGITGVSAQQIPRRKTEGEIPLSYSQEWMWLLEQLTPSVYNNSLTLKLTGQLNYKSLEKALNEIVVRHEALRTKSYLSAGTTKQFIAPPANYILSIVDVSSESEARKQVIAETKRPFQLEKDLPWRAVLFRISEIEHWFHLTLHHIVDDDQSDVLWVKELTVLYEAFSENRPSPLSELPIQYADFALWQREQLQGENYQKLLNYWQKQLGDLPPALNLPFKQQPDLKTLAGDQESIILSQELTSALKSLSQQAQVTLFTLLLTALKILLYRYTGQSDLIVGTPTSWRQQAETQSLIGVFMNNLVLRSKLSGDISFLTLLRQVQDTVLEAQEHSNLPYLELATQLQNSRVDKGNSLFQVMLDFQGQSLPVREVSGLTWESLEINPQTAKVPLALHLEEDRGELRGFFGYNTGLFDRDTIIRAVGHFGRLLEGIVANPDQVISKLPLLTASEQQQILVEWNQTKTEYPQDKCIHQLFEEQVQKTPEAVAVVFENQQLTYRELNTRANQLAHYLQKLGVEKEVLVGICVERSLEMVIGLLSILKAGGAYVPLDPAYPKERLAFMVEDSEISVLLTQENLLKALPPKSAQVICLDSDWKNIATHQQNSVNNNIYPNNLSYIIYTSGSTGKPKGVQIAHRNVINFFTAMQEKLQLTNIDNLLSVTTLSFDIAVLEIFLPLTTGAKLILVSRETATDGTQLLQKLNNSAVTLMQATPATWRMLLDAGWEGNSQLKILCGGEALSQNLASQLCQKAASVWNLYGPTETTIWSTIHQVDKSEAFVPIGRPIANTQIYILDKYLQPVPIGVPGELYIGGTGLAQGYFHQPELTQEKFIPDPFTSDSKSRIYKTSDLARYLPNGDIEYLGRIDHQFKLRGFRIETGEIETTINQHQEIRETVVIVREDKQDDKRLVAYFIPQSTDVSVLEIQNFLKSKLPDYMIPSAFVVLEEFPLTPNGKIDRHALPKPSFEQINTEFIPPRTEIEVKIAEIWSQVLGIDTIGIDDKFFALGGHSLLATQVISRLFQVFGVKLSFISFFSTPTIAGLSQEIEKLRGVNDDYEEGEI
ncbi:amino acid adenylation domain-containing protein [Anabaena sp. UHCC 0451]|uniref:non-ribosomal peptide synthetase n=1 Tax=Anabaena sp. UHCC 0451 TaxID=2055235 RepID=UPI002B1F74A1|nr:amino acid adenylation domain-containing protein [Anabaena sp. UHCC 0451]MEA5577739.1 amino acid adenylation domain-containing protein [Anabaena sp. UHCC 0451]